MPFSRFFGFTDALPPPVSMPYVPSEPVEEVAGVRLRNHLRFVVGHLGERLLEHCAAHGVLTIVMREVALPHELVDALYRTGIDGGLVADETGPEVLLEQLHRRLRTVDCDSGPFPGVLHP